MSEVQEMLVDQLKDVYSAEKQVIQGLKKALRNASDPKLKEGIDAHIDQSETQRERIEQALTQLGEKPGRKVCEAMRGIIEEAQHEQQEHEKGPIMDLVLVAGLQRVEHYEICAYGIMVELAKAVGENEVADLLGQTLGEEKAMDEQLTQVTRDSILPAALEGEDEDADEDAEEKPAKKARSKASTKSGK